MQLVLSPIKSDKTIQDTLLAQITRDQDIRPTNENDESRVNKTVNNGNKNVQDNIPNES